MPARTSAKGTPPLRPEGFSVDARRVLQDLRRTTAGVLSALGGVDRPVRLAERLGIDRSLAWKVWQVAEGAQDCPSPAHIPGRAAYVGFLTAARSAGLEPGVVDPAAAAFDALQAVLRAHAGDRTSGAIMLGALSSEGRERFELTMRRQAFAANSHFLGVQASTVYQADVLLRSPRGYLPRVARLRAHYGLRQTRADVAWVLGRSTLVNAQGPSSRCVREPLLAGPVRGDGCPLLLAEFCSTPLPNVTRRILGGVTVEDELQPRPVGQAGAVTVVMGELVSEIPASGQARDAVVMSVATPCERLVYEVIAEAGLLDAGGVTLRVHSTVHGDLPFLRGEVSNAIPVPEAFKELGPLAATASPVEVPRHAEMLAWLAARLGADVGRLSVWRVQMRMPPIPSCVAGVYSLTGR